MKYYLLYLWNNLPGDIPIIFESHVFVVDEIYNSTHQTEPSGKQIEYSHSNLTQNKSMNACGKNKSQNGR